MSEPFIGEIRMFGGTFAPVNWQFCNGQLVPIRENMALFGLIGETYGGDGKTTFALPNLQSRIPINQGQGSGLSNRTVGEQVGVETVTLTTQEIPVHSHPLVASTNPGGATSPADQVLAAGTNVQFFRAIAPNVAMPSNVIGTVGGSQPHENLMPYVVINYIICCTDGIFPPFN